MKRIVKIGAFIFSLFTFLFVGKVEVKAELLESWGYEKTNMDDFLIKINKEASSTDKNDDIVVAVLDTGIDTDHEWFKDKNGNSRILHEYAADCDIKVGYTYKCRNHLDDSNVNYEDIYGHGTGAAGIIAKATPDNVKIIPLKGSDDDDEACKNKWVDVFTSDYCGIDGIEIALEYIINLKVNHGVNIVALNYSVGNDYYSDYDSYYQRLASLVSDAYDAGILFVVAAGNERDDTTKSWVKLEDAQKAIMVSALTRDPVGNMIFEYLYSNYGWEVDFAAPATYTLSAAVGGGLQLFSGTSAAAPHVTAQIALMYAACPNCSIQDIEKTMKVSAVDMGDIGKDPKYGYGYIDMNIAYAKLAKGDKPVVTIKINGAGSLNYSYGAMNWESWFNRNYPYRPDYTGDSQSGILVSWFNTPDIFAEMTSDDYFEYREKSKTHSSRLLNPKILKIEVEMGDEIILSPSLSQRGFMFKSVFRDVQVDGEKAIVNSLRTNSYMIHDIRENTIININYNIKFCIFGICF